MTPVTAYRAAALLLNPDHQKSIGKVVVAVLSPLLLLVALLCCLGSGAADQNTTVTDLCFLGGTIPQEADEEFRQAILDMRESLQNLETVVTTLEQDAGGQTLDALQIKAVFFVLCFGGDGLPLGSEEALAFAEHFIRYGAENENGRLSVTPLSLTDAYASLTADGYTLTDAVQADISAVYARYSYSYTGGSFSGDLAYGSGGSTALSISGFTSPNTKNAADLVVYVKYAWQNQWGYVWGTYGQVLTESLLDYKIEQYPDGVGGYEDFIRSTWLGRRSADCVGLIKGYGWLDPNTLTIKYGTNGMQDVGADSMYRNATVKGTIDTIPEVPGLAVWCSGHIGVYIGNGEVIEAMGTKYGVVKTKLSERSFTHWLEIPYINY
jgi:hypothetical protein